VINKGKFVNYVIKILNFQKKYFRHLVKRNSNKGNSSIYSRFIQLVARLKSKCTVIFLIFKIPEKLPI